MARHGPAAPAACKRGDILQDSDTLWDEGEYQELSDILKKEKAFLFSKYKNGYIIRRVSSRLFATRSNSLRDYISKIKSDQKELEKLYDTLTINESSFFRNMEVFEYIAREIFQKVIKHKLKNRINNIDIWSAGCSTGEEPYSTAYMLKSKLGIRLKKFKVRILATDVDKKALKKAEAAVYYGKRVENLDQKIVRTMFGNVKGNHRVKTVYRDMVDFQHQDILEFKPMNRRFDMILCRNMLIYFSDRNHVDAYKYFNQNLVESGYLVLGKAEVMLTPGKYNFAQFSIKNRVYMKVV
jgi:chemotaxis methyl-accepting protein methylase